ncbi:uncharacterized protein LOC135171591 [Diachasmimorpha longicaudata]|uniref:uncharacterized protein LOC135171591 n=1 Tax=Diachasmimorpha longicaudata TaxID=58733 RepID=UPI0030B9120E
MTGQLTQEEMDRVTELTRKMISWKGQNTVMRGFLQLYQTKPPELPVLEARVAKYLQLYEHFETLMDELDELDQAGKYHKLAERFEIEATHFEVLTEAERAKNPRPSASASTIEDQETNARTVSSLSVSRYKVKLPESKLPIFKGDVGKYISWKTEFNSVIGNRDDIDPADKLRFLKSALEGEAYNKIQMLDLNDANYERAWQVLDKVYYDERVIISRHLHALLSLPRQDKEEASGLSNLVDITRQHLESLKSMDVDIGEPIIVALLERRIHKTTLDAWDEKQERDKFPKLDDMLEFISRRASRLLTRAKDKPVQMQTNTSAKQNAQKSNTQKRLPQSTHAFTAAPSKACPACQETQHFSIYRCEKFKTLPVTERVKIATEAKVCLNCLNHHGKIPCRYGPCKHCPEYHNTLLHRDQSNSQKTTVMTARTLSNQLMTTAIIHVLDKSQRAVKCRVLLDTGASSNFMTERLTNILNLHRKPYKIPIETLHELNTFTKDVVTATIKSTQSQYSMELSFLTVPRIASNIPMETVSRESLNIPKNIRLADPEFHVPAPVDLLIGTGPTLDLLSIGQIKLSSPNSPPLSLQKTQLGWIIGGTMPTESSTSAPARCHFTNVSQKKEDITFDLQRFWEIEEGPQEKHLSKEELQTVEHFKQSFSRDSSGRYTVALPFNGKEKLLGESYSMALKRYHGLERKFNRDPELQQQYSSNIQEYLQLNYLTEVKDASEPGFYLPHHAVVKKDSLKTKVRVVYDASAKSTTNISLNDCLMVGPTLQADIFWLILQFRCQPYVLTGDIEKMYLQFSIRPEDRKYQRILWRKANGELATFQLNNVTFGLASSPFQAVQCLHQLADDEAHRYPEAAEILKTNVYMDDLLTGFETIQGGIQTREAITSLLEAGGLTIRHWASNNPQLLQGLPPEAIHQTLQLDEGSTLKTLGVFWDAQSDSIVYTVKPVVQKKTITKRFIMSEIAKIYDPLGLLGPVILSAKTIIQKLWQVKSSWDESVPEHIQTEWTEFCLQLNTLLYESLVVRFRRVADPLIEGC